MKNTTAERLARVEQALSLVRSQSAPDVASQMLALLADLGVAASHHGLDFDLLAAAFQQGRGATTAGPSDQTAYWDPVIPDPVYSTDTDKPTNEFETEYDSSGNENPIGLYSYGERQTRPLSEQTLDDFDDFFRRCEGLTFIFLASSEVNTVYPNVIVATALADCYVREARFEPTIEEHACLRSSDFFSRRELMTEIQARVAEMDRRGAEYRFIWNLAGDPDVYVDGSDEKVSDDEIGSLLAEEIQELF